MAKVILVMFNESSVRAFVFTVGFFQEVGAWRLAKYACDHHSTLPPLLVILAERFGLRRSLCKQISIRHARAANDHCL